jgi:hypothetical protein
MDTSDELQRLGITSVGEIDSTLIDNVRAHLGKPAVKRRLIRQTELEWNADCDAVFAYFEKVSQSRTAL